MASNARKVALNTGADTVVSTIAEGVYYGFTVRETTGSATATVKIYDNASAASGKLLDIIQLIAGESAREWYGPQGIHVANGIYAALTGAIEGSVRIG